MPLTLNIGDTKKMHSPITGQIFHIDGLINISNKEEKIFENYDAF